MSSARYDIDFGSYPMEVGRRRIISIEIPRKGGRGIDTIKIKLTIEDDRAIFDLTGSHSTIKTIYNSAYGATFFWCYIRDENLFPEVPLNAGVYRTLSIVVPDDTIVSARWPVAVSGFVMPFEKIMNATFALFSKIMPEKALACAFNIEYHKQAAMIFQAKRNPFLCTMTGWLGVGVVEMERMV